MATKTNRLWALSALVVMGTSFTACLKSVDTTPTRPVAAFAVINGIGSSTAMDFYDNSTKVQTNMAMGFGGINYQAYGGIHQFYFAKTGTTTQVATSTASYDSLKYYTLVSYGDSANAQLQPIRDDFSGASTSKLNFRFFNLSQNSAQVDLYLGDTKVDSNLSYVGNTSISTAFKPLANISSASILRVKVAGTTTVLAENTTANLQSGYIYTIYLTGMKDSVGPLKPKVSYIQSYY
ncbi:protein of unknown function [Chitinophaga sp. CF118]|uniref:DUF4397 domain-containing protein n=1 Tax=Chitinophaga sp. CF118 TaxID=1884367 RepID=UPI0008EE14C0|nr:DUF4397 domain-containing protein [Chitinophaga sp. CF118]SFE86427.1 protein of unknown function [Chitinophaga sp. CF118]